ncbi:hypothetical protein NQ318_018267 [Aromia moschata]|uniref:C2H2-type domain-containing protein n=1 Tax=Aromia moschata TaxID=1265417 RepID=A0AAV8ZFH7_9CUCU|nr:hypothetical protein NQ318_018267 [Aromia moschata]
MFLTMWVDRQFYLAKVLASSNNRQRLLDLKKNLENNLPVVSLQRLKPQDINSTKKSCETVCENEEVFQKQTLTVCNYCGILFEDSHECVLEQETRMTSLRCVHESVEGFQAGTSDLCMYCGMLVSNFNEHVLSHDPKYVADKDDAESIATVKYPTKQHYCVYCKQLQTKLARHLERKHKNESDVQNAMKSAKGSRERKLLFAQIQKKGDFCYKSEFQVQINVRRNISKKTENISIPCPYCKGFYSKSNLRNHLRLNCWVQHSDKVKQFEAMGLKNVQAMSRSIFPQIHERASVVLREKVFPVLNNDEVTRAVAHDELVIIYANLLVIKYSSSSHHHRMIRNKIRHIAHTASIFDPLNFDVFIEAVHNLAGLSDGHFAAPSVGPTSITLICKLENNVKQFLKLVTTTANALVTKTAIENRTQGQRSKVVTLPETEDVNQLYHSLSREMERCIEQLSNGFDSTTWVTLNKVTLTKIMIFNRKRPGDIERSQIVEYRNLQMVSEETLAKLNAAKQKNCC